ncbi:hypothetical protein [Bacteriophage Eos]|nr:hypothetical protein [Bacteriophage Eos]
MTQLPWNKVAIVLFDEMETLIKLALKREDLHFLVEHDVNKGLTTKCLSKTNEPEINWNDLSALGLVAYLNNVLFHPLGYAITRDPETGYSHSVLFENEPWEYADGILLEEMNKAEKAGILIEGWNVPWGDC